MLSYNRAGFSMIEAIVTMLIVSLAVLSATSLLASNQYTSDEVRMTQALNQYSDTYVDKLKGRISDGLITSNQNYSLSDTITTGATYAKNFSITGNVSIKVFTTSIGTHMYDVSLNSVVSNHSSIKVSKNALLYGG